MREITEAILGENGYRMGVRIDRVNIEQAAPPTEVVDAFDEVQRAEQDETRFQEEARRDANTVLGGARGQASQIREDAAAYKDRVVKEAQGEAARFTSIYQQYVKAPDVTRQRLYLETMEEVFGRSNKVIVDKSSSNLVPYLPLPPLTPRPPAAQDGNPPASGNPPGTTLSAPAITTTGN